MIMLPALSSRSERQLLDMAIVHELPSEAAGVEGCVLLAGPRGQFDLEGGQPLSALR